MFPVIAGIQLDANVHYSAAQAVPPRGGVSLKAAHVETILSSKTDIGFFEVHAENYMGAGGVPHRQLSAIRDVYPLSLHGVGLSIGGNSALDQAHLKRLSALNQRYQPGLFSEHLAWSSHEEIYLNDLLPVPYEKKTLERVCDHIDEFQNVMGRQILLENPSTYVAFNQSSMSEIDFISAIVKRTGCGLLMDINNVYVSAVNNEFSPEDYIDAFPVEHVQEVHLAGHAEDEDESGYQLLIDAHDREVDVSVWCLYKKLIKATGPLPTLIEWDQNVPDWEILSSQAAIADTLLLACRESAND